MEQKYRQKMSDKNRVCNDQNALQKCNKTYYK